jgi:RNA polymerase sigma factor for flagellar operon FliA
LEASDNLTSTRTHATQDGGDASAFREAELWREFALSGSAAVRQKLFDLYQTFARQIAVKQFLDRKSGDIEFADLCQFAYAGLLEALDRFDPVRGIPFRGFARRRITGSILDGLVHLSEIREQISFRKRVRAERLKSLTVDDPELLASADAMNALVEMATGLAVGFIIEDSGVYTVEDMADARPSPYDTLVWKQVVTALRGEISKLPAQQQEVVRYHYLRGLSFDGIARIMGLSRGRVSQIHRSALKILGNKLYQNEGFSYEK